MKKSIVYLGVALVAFANVSFASNFNSVPSDKIIVSVYEGISPLCIAVSKGDVDAVKKLIEYGVDVNEKSNGMTPLMFAARYNKVAILKVLLANGANLKAKDIKGFTALKYAELSNASEVISFLKSNEEHKVGQSTVSLSSIFVYEQEKALSIDELVVENPKVTLSSNSKRTFEKTMEWNEKIIEETDSDKLYPLDFKIIDSKSVFIKAIKSKKVVGMN